MHAFYFHRMNVRDVWCNYSTVTTSNNCHQLSDLLYICLVLVKNYLKENVENRVVVISNVMVYVNM